LPEGCRQSYPEILVLKPGDEEEKDALVKTSFHSDDNPLAPALPPPGVGAHCNAPGMKQMRVWDFSHAQLFAMNAAAPEGEAPRRISDYQHI